MSKCVLVLRQRTLKYFICYYAKLLLSHHTLYNDRYKHGLKHQIKTFRTTQCVLNKAFAYALAIGVFYILCI